MGTVPTFDDWTAKENPTAAKMNKNVRDAGKFFASPPTCIMRSTAAQTLTTGVETTISLDVADEDTDGMADLAGDQIVFKTAGLYIVSAQVVFATSSSGYRRLVVIDGTGANIAGATTGDAVSVQLYLECTKVRRFAVNDSVKASVQQASGGNLATVITGGMPSLSAVWVGK